MTTTQQPTRAKRSRGPDTATVLDLLGIEATNAGAWTLAPIATTGPVLASINPATGEPIADGRRRDAAKWCAGLRCGCAIIRRRSAAW